jgi:hypothetical protein
MCAISGSFSKSKLLELYRLNAYRGEMNHSLTSFEYDNDGRLRLGVLFQDDGPLDTEVLDSLHEKDDKYFLAHSQAPTTDTNSVHPAAYGDAMLWHNGIIKQKSMSPGTWDTAWLLEQILNYGWSSLSRVDGTFACVMFWGNNLYCFRNEISPLFVDKELNLSSTKAEGFESLKPNVVHKMNLEFRTLTPVAYFDTFENPYYFGDAA